MDPTPTAIGTWSGGRYMRFGEPLAEERLCALLQPGGGIDTVITADAYGAGEADSLLGRALADAEREGVARKDYCLIGAIGHDIYTGARDGAKGYPRFTDPRLRGASAYGDYLRMATERSLQRLGVDRFDVLLLHNPDRTGYGSEAVWDGMAALRDAGLARAISCTSFARAASSTSSPGQGSSGPRMIIAQSISSPKRSKHSITSSV